MWDVPGAACLSVCPEGSSPRCLDWGESKCGDATHPHKHNKMKRGGKHRIPLWPLGSDHKTGSEVMTLRRIYECYRSAPEGNYLQCIPMRKFSSKTEKFPFSEGEPISSDSTWSDWSESLLGIFCISRRCFENPHGCLNGFALLPSHEKAHWIDYFQMSQAIPHVYLESDGISWEEKKKDLQGTFVTGRMCYRKTPVHKSRTERINAGPPWKLRMSYSLRFPWLWASKSVAAKWLHLGFSFQCRVEFWGFTALKRLSPFDSMLNTKAQVIRPLMGSFFKIGLIVSSFRAHLLPRAHVSFTLISLFKS